MTLSFEHAMKHIMYEGIHEGESDEDLNQRLLYQDEIFKKLESKGLTLEVWILKNTPRPQPKIIVPNLLDQLIRRL